MSKTIKKITTFFSEVFQFPFLFAIRLYQKTLSPDHGPLKFLHPHGYCKFYPTCSEYGYQAIQKYGVVKGIWKATYRILRCNPWNQGGIDKP